MANVSLDRETNYIKVFDLTEIINGEEVMAPSPFSKHQRIIFKLAYLIKKHIEKSEIGEIFISPLDVILEEGVNRLQPDLIFIKNENLHIVQDWIRGVPDAVVEVVSENSFTLDTVIKKEIYERYGVKEFWLVFPPEKVIQIYTLQDGHYKLFNFAEQSGTVSSKIIEGLELSLEEVFQE
ncbi:MAG: Uma2 family endonuclease [Thermodesulfovibrionales bacterium]